VRPAAFTTDAEPTLATDPADDEAVAIEDAPQLLGPIHDAITQQAEFQPEPPGDSDAFSYEDDENILSRAPNVQDEPCPDPDELKPIGEITNDIAAEAGEFPPECTLGDDIYLPRQWGMTTYTWKASGLCHKPLYFEEVGLERYGHSAGPVLQPFISGAHFFGTLPILPYKMGLEPPCECIYALGYYRPGSCAPRMILPIGISLRGALFQAGAATGVAFLLP